MELRGLNERQLEAVKATEGKVRIIAGAGSGKTRVLAYRYAFLVDELGIDPGNILCLTFTNKAAQDEFRSCNAYSRPECKECWAKLYCSGGCAANAYHSTGSVTGVYKYGCELFKKRMECAIAVAVNRQLGGKN